MNSLYVETRVHLRDNLNSGGNVSKLQDTVDKLNEADPGTVGFYIPSIKQFKLFQMLCRSKGPSASEVLTEWIYDALAEVPEKKLRELEAAVDKAEKKKGKK